MRAKLTTKTVAALKPKESLYKVWDTEIPGYFLRVMPSGTKTYCLHYRHLGKGRDFTIGKSGKFTATTARETAQRRTGELAQGLDIQAVKKDDVARGKAEKYQTLGGFITEMYKPWVLAERKTGQATLDILGRDFSHLFSRKMIGLGA